MRYTALTTAIAAASFAFAQLPAYTPNTPSYLNDCDDTAGWTLAAGSLSQDRGAITLTPSGTAEATARQSVTMPIALKDYNLQASVRCANGSKQYIAIHETGQYTRKLYVYFNYNCVTNASQAGVVSLRRINNVGAQANKVAFTGIDTSEPMLISLSFDSRNARAVLSLKDAEGWRFGAHVTTSWHGGDIVLATQGTGSYITLDYAQIASPDIQAIGDSNCNGATTFSTVIAANKNDGNNQWHRWCDAYPDNRNTLIVNKGVNGNTSAAVLARIQSDVIDNAPKVVFLHACNNDYTQGVTLSTRHANIQASINTLIAAGIKVVLINALYGTQARATNPAERAYYEQSWTDGLQSWTGYALAIDVTQALAGPDGWQQASLTNPADGLHMNNAGAAAFGDFVEEN